MQMGSPKAWARRSRMVCFSNLYCELCKASAPCQIVGQAAGSQIEGTSTVSLKQAWPAWPLLTCPIPSLAPAPRPLPATEAGRVATLRVKKATRRQPVSRTATRRCAVFTFAPRQELFFQMYSNQVVLPKRIVFPVFHVARHSRPACIKPMFLPSRATAVPSCRHCC